MDAHSPEEIHSLFGTLARAREIDALVTLYDPRSLIVDLEGRELRGRNMLRAMLGEVFSRVTQFSSSRKRMLVNGDLALISNQWHARIATVGGDQSLSGTSAEIARRHPDGIWRLAIDDPRFFG